MNLGSHIISYHIVLFLVIPYASTMKMRHVLRLFYNEIIIFIILFFYIILDTARHYRILLNIES